jgi:hypothetical protein
MTGIQASLSAFDEPHRLTIARIQDRATDAVVAQGVTLDV